MMRASFRTRIFLATSGATVLALVVVNALRGSPWGLFTISATIPFQPMTAPSC